MPNLMPEQIVEAREAAHRGTVHSPIHLATPTGHQARGPGGRTGRDAVVV
jgi:hypothetical protein